MSKKDSKAFSKKAPDLTFNPEAAAAKMPTPIAPVSHTLIEFVSIRCADIIPYTQKNENDFRPWSQDQFDLLVESIKRHGVMEPVVVRPTQDHKYEMLAGEHRWKASVQAGLETIPARIMRNCDDDMARAIFAMTNVLRRENTLRDKVIGWWHYKQLTNYMRNEALDDLVDQNIISSEAREEATRNKRQIARYAKMHDLLPALLDLAEDKKLGTKAAEILADIDPSKQHDLLEYKDRLNDQEKAMKLRDLSKSADWDDTHIREILYGTNAHDTKTALTKSSQRLRTVIAATVQKEAYQAVFEAMEMAINEYLEQHPEARRTPPKIGRPPKKQSTETPQPSPNEDSP